MTDSEIVKALEDAEYKVNGVVTQGFYLSVETFNAVVDLINRQQAEIERLEQNLKEAHIDIKEHRAEIERLNGEVATYKRIGDKKTETVIQHDDFIRDLHKEIERLTERNFELAEKGEAVCIAYKTARAEVTEQLSKKIERRLANNTDISNAQYQSIIFDISEACKEMVGEQK